MQMTIRMPDEYKSRIDEIVNKTGLKKSDIARIAIKNFLEGFEAREQGKKPAAEAKDLIGVVDSGIPDLGTNHRRHLLNKIKRQ
jgi:metal-responsive CopG/Arc/MetJ family transcriptional regulator